MTAARPGALTMRFPAFGRNHLPSRRTTVSVAEVGPSQPYEFMNSAKFGVTVEAIARAIEARIRSVPRSDIDRMVVEELLHFQDARVTNYIPLIVEHAVITRLQARPTAVRVAK